MRMRVLPWAATPSASAGRDIKWAEGLRGIASLLVVTSHLTRAFAPTLLAPAESETTSGSIFHLPILRLPAQGPPWVALFFLLTGYVNAMKPIKQARNGSISQALSGLSSSTLRRTARLVLPPTIVTIASWALCQMGGYRTGKNCEAAWIRDTSPVPTPSLIGSVKSLINNCFTTWSTGSNAYDPIQWTLPFLLKGSMLIYLTLLATVRTQAYYRVLTFLGLYAFSWAGRDPMTGMNIYFGALLAEFSTQLPSSSNTTKRPLLRLLPIPILLLGLHLSGYPEVSAEWASWSGSLAHIGDLIYPRGSEYWRYWPTLGAQLVTIAIVLSPSLQQILSHPALLWLGGLSFPLYLLHGPLIRSVLSWMLFGLRSPIYYYTKNLDGSVANTWERIPVPPGWVFCVAMPAFFIILLTIAHFWTLFVEPWCAQVTKRIEEVMYGDQSQEIKEKGADGQTGNILGGHSRNNGVFCAV
ncbi:hypothetical protein MMC28_010882 [Mycoblastus sanguinarius]|nr:hypothetical protein [Mycoblastus sanguinarius]